MFRDNPLNSRELGVRSYLPSVFRHAHFTTFLNPVGSHRPFTWLTCARTHARVLARVIPTLPHVRDNSSVSAAPSACTLHTRTCPPFTCCHSHLTTFLIQAGSHRFSTWLTCVRTHARALARGILTFTHVPRHPLNSCEFGVRPYSPSVFFCAYSRACARAWHSYPPPCS